MGTLSSFKIRKSWFS